jgi:hypothetical protein
MVLQHSGGDLPQNVNFATQAGPLRDFLIRSALRLTIAPEGAPTGNFEEAKKSIALIRAGHVTDEELKRQILLCRFGYFSIWDMFFRFQVFEIELYDLKKGDWILRGGQYGDNPFSTEDGVLDRTFEQICAKLLPDKPNPFKAK